MAPYSHRALVKSIPLYRERVEILDVTEANLLFTVCLKWLLQVPFASFYIQTVSVWPISGRIQRMTAHHVLSVSPRQQGDMCQSTLGDQAWGTPEHANARMHAHAQTTYTHTGATPLWQQGALSRLGCSPTIGPWVNTKHSHIHTQTFGKYWTVPLLSPQPTVLHFLIHCVAFTLR